MLENKINLESLSGNTHFPKPEIIGKSPAIQKVIEMTQKVSNVDLNVLITGESGVGKELVARSLHYYSPQREAPFVKVNSAALPSELLESELFGYEKGAFTGAERSQMGKFELAGKGSLFLDEIGEIPLFMQSKLLHVLQDRKYHRVGGQKEVQVKARLIAATNQDLDNEIITGNFREDLYYRLTTITIHIPPLRERKEDIDYLIEYFIQKFQIKHGIPKINIPSRLLELFYEYQWPGNIRELENYLKRLSVLRNFRELEEKICKSIDSYNSPKTELADKKTITPEPAEFEVKLEDNSFPSLKEVRDQAVRRVENMIIRQALEETHWNRKKVAKILKISYRALLYKMKDMNITPTYK